MQSGVFFRPSSLVEVAWELNFHQVLQIPEQLLIIQAWPQKLPKTTSWKLNKNSWEEIPNLDTIHVAGCFRLTLVNW